MKHCNEKQVMHFHRKLNKSFLLSVLNGCKFVFFFVIFAGTVLSAEAAELQNKLVRVRYPDDKQKTGRFLFETAVRESDELHRKLGAIPGQQTTIILAASEYEFRRITRGRLPEWSGGVALGDGRTIVLKPLPVFDKNGYRELLLHEMAHIYFAAIPGSNRFPLWLNEGIAMQLSGRQLKLEESISVANALFNDKVLLLSEIDRLLRYPRAQANLAYIQSLLAVNFLSSQIGENKMPEFLRELARSQSMDATFLSYTGKDMIDFEFAYFAQLEKKYKWLVILNFESLSWLAMLLMILLIYIAIKIRNYRRLKKWEEEEDLFWQGD